MGRPISISKFVHLGRIVDIKIRSLCLDWEGGQPNGRAKFLWDIITCPFSLQNIYYIFKKINI
jgi:hypothetical protein